jgi:hypothetical protein
MGLLPAKRGDVWPKATCPAVASAKEVGLRLWFGRASVVELAGGQRRRPSATVSCALTSVL